METRRSLLTGRLVNVRGLQAHQVGQLVDDELSLGGAFVDALDAAALPVGPVDEVAQQSETEDVRKFVLHQHPSPRPVHVHHLRDGQRRASHTEHAQSTETDITLIETMFTTFITTFGLNT